MNGYTCLLAAALIAVFVGMTGLDLDLVRWWRSHRARPEGQAPEVIAVPDLPGPVEEWPWGQEPSTWMLDPSGHLAGPLSNPEGWVAAHRSYQDKEAR